MTFRQIEANRGNALRSTGPMELRPPEPPIPARRTTANFLLPTQGDRAEIGFPKSNTPLNVQ
jgi:hypothetical protein